jgi:hypothetical protein
MESAKVRDKFEGRILRNGGSIEKCGLSGLYVVKCFGKLGKMLWEDTIKNLVTTAGKNLVLDTLMAGSNYSVTGPYMGLISSIGWSAVAAGDTMSSHSGWNEAGSGVNYPLYSGTRKTCVWSAAGGGAKALSSALSFSIITTGGTIKGAFIVLGTGAVATIADTNGVLYSCGAFTGGDKVVGVGDTLQVSYTTDMNA